MGCSQAAPFRRVSFLINPLTVRQPGEVLPRYQLRTLSASWVNAFDSQRIPIVVTQRLQPQWARRGRGATVTSSRALDVSRPPSAPLMLAMSKRAQTFSPVTPDLP
jgi:hypothetical protein